MMQIVQIGPDASDPTFGDEPQAEKTLMRNGRIESSVRAPRTGINRPVSFSPPGLCQIHSYNITQFPANYQAAFGEARGLAGFQGHR